MGRGTSKAGKVSVRNRDGSTVKMPIKDAVAMTKAELERARQKELESGKQIAKIKDSRERVRKADEAARTDKTVAADRDRVVNRWNELRTKLPAQQGAITRAQRQLIKANGTKDQTKAEQKLKAAKDKWDKMNQEYQRLQDEALRKGYIGY